MRLPNTIPIGSPLSYRLTRVNHVATLKANRELLYIHAAVEALGKFGGGGVFDKTRVFFTGCSMGSVRGRFPAEIYTRGCHWIPRMFASI
jgi:hypothetical protein